MDDEYVDVVPEIDLIATKSQSVAKQIVKHKESPYHNGDEGDTMRSNSGIGINHKSPQLMNIRNLMMKNKENTYLPPNKGARSRFLSSDSFYTEFVSDNDDIVSVSNFSKMDMKGQKFFHKDSIVNRAGFCKLYD